MNDLVIEKTKSTPYISFNSLSGLMVFQGESFPENAARFYAPVLDWIKQYVSEMDDKARAVMEFEIIYFNSSTSKIFMTIFDFMEEAVKNGKSITVKWICDENNDTAIECGEEFKEDLTELPFNIITS